MRKCIFMRQVLDKVLTEVGSDERLMVCGDFLKHIGESIDGFEGVHRGSGFGARNLEGAMLLEFADFAWRDKGRSREKAVYVGRCRVWKFGKRTTTVSLTRGTWKLALSAAVCGGDMEGDWNTLKLIC